MSRRRRGEGSVYRYRDGYAAQISVQTPDGKRRRPIVYGKTEAEVIAKKQTMEHEVRLGTRLASRPPTVATYGESWINGTLQASVVTGNLAATTRANYAMIWDRYIKPDLGHLRLNELSTQVLRAWLVRKATEPSTRGGTLSPRTQQLAYAVLRRALNDAVRDDLIHANPLARVQGPRGASRPAEPLTVDEAKALLATTQSEPLYALWVVLISIGLRVGEALALTWADVDLDRSVLRVSRSVSRLRGDRDPTTGRHRTVLIVKQPKTVASAATIALPAFLVQTLRAHRVRQAEDRLASRHWQDNDLVFCSSVGTLLEARNVLRQFKDAARRAGIGRNVRVHDTRHTAASFLLAAKVDLKIIQTVLRHSRLATTSDLYVHLLDDVKHEAAHAMDTVLRDIGPSADMAPDRIG